MSNIDTNDIDKDFPIAAQDNDSQGFRNNFTNIVAALDVAQTEISDIEEIQGRLGTLTGSPPASPQGVDGDKAGMIYFTSPYIYFCFKDWTIGGADIWVRASVGEVW